MTATVSITFQTTTENAAALAQTLAGNAQPCACAQPTAPVVVETVEIPVVQAAVPVQAKDLDAAVAMLDDERYTLRTAKSLMEKSRYTDMSEMIRDLEARNDGSEIVTKTRRNDRAVLIGWAFRN